MLSLSRRFAVSGFVLAVLLLTFSSASTAFADSVFFGQSPAPGSVTPDTRPTISVEVVDTTSLKSGPPNTYIAIDGVAQKASQVTFRDAPPRTEATIRFVPTTDLSIGVHTVTAYARGKGNQVTSTSWFFTVALDPVLSNPTPAPGSTAATGFPTISAKVTQGVVGIVPGAVLDGASTPAAFDPATGLVTVPLQSRLSNGSSHEVTVTVANAFGISTALAWDFDVQLYPPLTAADLDCQGCHAAYPLTHSSANCQGCHGSDSPVGEGWSGTPVHGAEKIANMSCTYCHGGGFASVPELHSFTEDTYHESPPQGCAVGSDCHVATLASEHGRYDLSCATCHMSSDPVVIAAITAKSVECASCHTFDPNHPYQYVDHTAGVIMDAGPGDLACGECHLMDVLDEHAKPTSSSATGGCVTCHPTPADSLATWEQGCAQGLCHPSGTSLSIHASITAKHAPDDGSGGCMSAVCHQDLPADIAAIHSAATTVTAGGEARTGCRVCHSDSVSPLSGDCIGCHADKTATHYDGLRHAATPASATVSIAGTDFGDHSCDECHALDLATEHADPAASPSATQCEMCHPSPKNTVAGAWDGSCAQGGCHTAGSTVPMHAALEPSHAVPPGSCTTPACHGSASSVAAVHSASGCAACHSAGSTLATECSACHSVTSPHVGLAAAVSVEASPAAGAPPLAVSLVASPIPDPVEAWTWAWQFGDGATGSGSAVMHTYSDPGTYTASVTVTDHYGAQATTSTVIVATRPALPTVQISATPDRIHTGENVTLTWSTSDASSVVVSPGVGPVSPSGSMVVTPADDTVYTIAASGPGGSATAEVLVTVVAVDPPPTGSLVERYDQFVPTDATLDSYDPARFALVVGRVLDTQGAPLSGVRVRAKDADEYGSVLTDASGRYALPLDGGDARVLCFERDGLMAVQRNVAPAWNEVSSVDDVRMTPRDSQATTIAVGGVVLETQMHTGAANSDERGSRAVTLVFPAGERAYSVGADGHYTELDSLTVRTTEFTTSTAMPGALPKTSAFTYCVDLSADEANHVVFDKPVVAWLDDFLGVGPGALLPSGSYDEAAGAWKAEQNGISVRLLDADSDGVIDGADINNDGVADDLNANGATTDEVEGLEQGRFAPGSVAWRVEVSHFSPWDWNFSWALDTRATAYTPLKCSTTGQTTEPPSGSCSKEKNVASTIDVQNGVVGEDLPVAGTSMTLHYSSDRVRTGSVASGGAGTSGAVSWTGAASGGSLAVGTPVYVPIDARNPPGDATGVKVRLKVAGRTFEQWIPAGSTQDVMFAWDGTDALGLAASGDFQAQLSAAWVYPVHYTIARYQGSGTLTLIGIDPIWAVSAPTAVGTPGDFAMSTRVATNLFAEVATFKALPMAVAPKAEEIAEGWTLSAVPSIDSATGRTLYRGDGTWERGQARYGQDGAYAGSYAPADMDMGPDGKLWSSPNGVYLAATNTKTRVTSRVATRPTGRVTTLCADRSGGVYYLDKLSTGSPQLFHMKADGSYVHVAGNGTLGTARTDVPAVDSPLAVMAMDVDAEGTLMVRVRDGSYGDSGRILALGADGYFTCIAGGGTTPPSSVPTLAVGAAISGSGAIACTPDGSIYAVNGTYLIHKITRDGTITRAYGVPPQTGSWNVPEIKPGKDWSGQLATGACLRVSDLAIDAAGHLLILDTDPYTKDMVWEVDELGLMRGIAGARASTDGENTRISIPGPATKSMLWNANKLMLDPGGSLWIRMGSGTSTWVEKVVSDRPLHSSQGSLGFVERSGVAHVFAAGGRWLATNDASTGLTILSAQRDASGRLTGIADRFGATLRVERDTDGRATAIVSQDGARTQLTIDGANRLAGVEFPDGNRVSVAYHANGLLGDVTNPRGGVAHHYYDGIGRATRVVDEDGRTFEFPASANSDGTFTSSMHTSEGTFATYRDSFDQGGWTNAATTGRGSTSTLTVSADDLVVKQTTPSGTSVFTRGWDGFLGALRPLSSVVTMPSGLKRTVAYDRSWVDANADGRAESRTDKVTLNGRLATSITDLAEGKVTVTSPAGRTVQSFYDPSTLLPTRTEVPGILPVIPTYDSRGRVTSATQGGRTVSYSYDASGNVESVTGPDGRTVSYAHDLMGRTTAATRPDSSTAGFAYDAGGALTSLTTPGGAVNTFSSSLRGLPEGWTAPQSGSWTYSYDGAKHLKTATAPSGATIENTFDANGLQVGSTFSGGSIGTFRGKCGKVFGFARASETASLTYDGSLLTKEVLRGSVADTLAWTYNTDFAPTAFTYAGATQSYGYDSDGLMTSAAPFTIIRRSDNGLATSVSAPGFSLARSFSAYGELDGVQTPAYAFGLSRDVTGRITSRTETGAAGPHEWSYGYDVLGRLTSATRDGVLAEAYAYDAQGNRVAWRAPLSGIETTQEASFDAEDRMVSRTGASYTWTADGELESKTTSAGVTTYSWTGLGELESVALPGGRTVGYRYDASGNRVARLVDGEVTERYEWAGPSRPLAVWDGAGALVARFLYADGRTPYAVDTPSGRLFLAYDQVGSLTAVADASGAVVRSVERDSFGNLISDSAPGVVPWLGFAGGMPDADTGLTHFGARDYDPSLGRWVSKDPIGFAGGDADLFAYCGGDPVNMIDPKGLWTVGVGVQGAASLGGGGTTSLMVVFDHTGDTRLLWSGGGGVGAEASAGIAGQWTSAGTVEDTLGSALDISGNCGSYGGDFYKGARDAYIDDNGNSVGPSFRGTYWGGAASWGAGVGGGAYLPRTFDLTPWLVQRLRDLGFVGGTG